MMIIVFGGAGFVGRPLARALYRAGNDVLIADNLTIKPEESLPAEVRFAKLNVCSVSQVREIMKLEPDVIYFLAARQGYRKDWSKYAKTNIFSAYGLFEVIASMRPYKPERIILASSQAVYAPGVDVCETYALMPHSIYGMTKLQQEWAFLRLGHELKIPIVAFRYSIILGAGQSMQSSESGILRNWYRSVQKGQPPKIYGMGVQRRDFVHVNDVTAANLQGLTCSPGVYNIGGWSSSITEMARIFHEEVGGPEPIITNKDFRPGGEYTLTSNCSHARRELSWTPVLDIKKMVSDFHVFAQASESDQRNEA